MSSSTPSGTGESRRRAEIEAKRAKLAEMRRQREERTTRIHAGRSTTGTPAPGSQGPGTASEADTPLSSHRRDLDDLVATLVGPSGTSSPRPSNRHSLGPEDAVQTDAIASPSKQPISGSDYTDSAAGGPGSTLVSRADGEIADVHRRIPEMVDVEAELFEFPQKERVYYTKEVQTTTASTSTDTDDLSPNDDVSPTAEAAIRKKILQEQQAEREAEQAEKLAQEEAQLDKAIEEELRIMSPDEVQAIFGQPDFADFVEHSSKMIERALTDSYDFLKDYTRVDGTGPDATTESRSVKQTRAFYDDKLCKGRTITGLNWSVQHPELVVASYSRSGTGTHADSPDGLVLVWNLHLLDRPEFIFHAQTDVLSVAFSPFHPNIVIGGTYSGQILIWDTRAKQLPVLKSPLSAAGHTHPVYSLQVVGTQNAHHLVTASTDGLVCSWMLDMLAQPQDSLELINPSHPKTDEVAITCMDFPLQETTQFWVGTEEGNIYVASRFDRAGSKAGLQMGEVYKGHAAFITSLHFHSSSSSAMASGSGPVDFSDLFLSSSMDWTAKLWRIRGGASTNSSTTTTTTNSTSISTNATASTAASTLPSSASSSSSTRAIEITPLLSFEESGDYVMDVKWHPVNPSIFALVDATGQIHLYDLLYDTERPLVTNQPCTLGLNKLAFDHSKEGKNLAVGGVDGKVYVLDVTNVVRNAGNEDKELVELQRMLRGRGAV